MDGAALRAAFVFGNPRQELAAGVARGLEPDSTLFGANHLAALGVDARVHDPFLTRGRVPRPLFRAAWSLRELPLPWEVGDADVVFTPLANLFPLVARARRRLGVVVVNYGLNVILARSSRARRRVLAASLAAARRVVCLAESQRVELLDRTGIDPELVETLPVPVDDGFYAPRGQPGHRGFVLTVGKDLSRDFATFAAAVAPLSVPIELVVHPRNLAGVALTDRARVRVRIPSLELRDLYAGAACVVVPQQPDGYVYGSEGGGLTALLEAMAMARPVVVTERAALRDYVEPGRDALVVPPHDPGALREAVERVLGDSELSASLGAAGRARVERSHTTRGFAAALAPILQEAAVR
jgi:glycosyltransferase involved in cell wall biosynthesis